jgi:hypothetical protein
VRALHLLRRLSRCNEPGAFFDTQLVDHNPCLLIISTRIPCYFLHYSTFTLRDLAGAVFEITFIMLLVFTGGEEYKLVRKLGLFTLGSLRAEPGGPASRLRGAILRVGSVICFSPEISFECTRSRCLANFSCSFLSLCIYSCFFTS